MAIRSPRRIPRRFSRPVSRETKRFVANRMQRKARKKTERWKRIIRRFQASATEWRKMAVRWAAGIVAVLCIVASGMILFSPLLSVRSIEVIRRNPRLDIEEVQQALAPLFGRKMLLLPSFEAEHLLKEHISDVRDVVVTKAFPSTLRVAVDLNPLIARLEIASPDALDRSATGTGADIDFLTSDGKYAVTTSGAEDNEALPVITIVDWGARPQIGDEIISAPLLQRMNAAEVVLLRQFGQEVKKRVVYLRAQEFHLLIENEKSLWLDLKSPMEEQMQRYRVFLKDVGLEKVKEYVDLRISGRVIYK